MAGIKLHPRARAEKEEKEETEEQEEQEEKRAQVVAHHLPCTIHTDGPLSTARAFTPLPEPLRTFRGRRLEHASFRLAESHQLVVIQQRPSEEEDKAVDGDDACVEYDVTHHVHRQGFHYAHDDVPTDSSPLPAALDWLSLSAALHAPLQPLDPEEQRATTKT